MKNFPDGVEKSVSTNCVTSLEQEGNRGTNLYEELSNTNKQLANLQNSYKKQKHGTVYSQTDCPPCQEKGRFTLHCRLLQLQQ